MSENSKLFLQEKASSFYEQALSLCYKLYQESKDDSYLDKALHFLEKSRSSVLSEALQVSDVNSIQGVPDEVLVAEKRMDGYVSSIELKLGDAEIGDSDSLQSELRKQLFHARVSVDSLVNIIRNNYPNYYDLKYEQEVVSSKQIQETLPEDGLSISIYEGEEYWYVYSMSQTDIKFSQTSKLELTDLQVIDLIELIRDPNSSLEKLLKLSHEVYQQLIANHVRRETKSVIIVPGGVLNHLPFEALQIENPSNGPKYLVEGINSSYVSSLTINYRDRNKLHELRDQSYVGFAPDYQLIATEEQGTNSVRGSLTKLSRTKEEVLEAANIFSGEAFLDDLATESQFKSMDSHSSVLHLAMQALVDDNNPMLSNFVFSNKIDSVEDGNLNAYEIYNLEIPSELAVLSACNTGFEKLNRGEGVISLSRAFMYAGCSNILMSLWEARDKPTTQIIIRFFENLKNEMPKDQALRQAKLRYLESADPLGSHPANWATLVMIGNTEPITFPGIKGQYFIVAVLVIFLLLIALRYSKQSENRTASKGH